MLITCRRNKSPDDKIMHLRLSIPRTQYSQPSQEIPQLVGLEIAVVVAEAAELPIGLRMDNISWELDISFPTAAVQTWQKIRAVVFADCTLLATTSHFVVELYVSVCLKWR